MPQTAIFVPFFGMLLLTIAVWILLYLRRLTYIRRTGVPPSALTTPPSMEGLLPDHVNLPVYNLRNLFELPVVFYAICLYLFITQQVDTWYVAGAWLFLAFRILHSVVHCTSNRMPLRFTLYVFASLPLWLMVIRAAIGVFIG